MGLQIRNSFFDECGFGLVLGLGSCDSVFFLQIMLRQAPKLPLCNAGSCEIAPSGDAWNVQVSKIAAVNVTVPGVVSGSGSRSTSCPRIFIVEGLSDL